MKVGILSDTHDRLDALDELLKRLQEAGATMMLHAGDYCAPFSLLPFLYAGTPMAGVFGRNDGDHEGIRAFAQRGMGIELFESPHSMELAGTRILIVHDIGEVPAQSLTNHSIVIHGNTHKPEMKERDGTLIVNPGEACGWLYGSPQAAIFDTDSKKVEFIQLPAKDWKR